MGTDLQQTDTGEMELAGSTGAFNAANFGRAGFEVEQMTYDPNSGNVVMFTADRSWRIKSLIVRIDAPGTDAAAVNVRFRKVTSGQAITAGTLVDSSTINLKGAANSHTVRSNASATWVPDAALLAPGDSLGLQFGGVLTSARGSITVTLAPV